MTLELHPLCTLFPRMAGAEFEALKADIVANGMREPIVVHAGLILDGGNRYRACIEASVKPVLKEFSGDSAVSFVLSANLHRRHLTPGQQAAIVASAQDWATAQSVGNPAFKATAQSGNVAGLATVADRVAQSGASERTQRMADSVARQSPDLARQVAHGEISLPKALEQLAPKTSAAAPKLKPPQSSAPVTVIINQVSEGSDLKSDPVPDADGHFDHLVAENKSIEQDKLALLAENRALADRIALLTRDDLAAAADEWKLKFEQLSGRNRQLQETARDAQLAEKRGLEMLGKIRIALGVESNAEILPALAARRPA